MASITSRVMTRCCTTFWMSTVGVAPVTVTVSWRRADPQIGVHRRREGRRQLDALALDRVEPGQREGHAVGAGHQADDLVLPPTVSDGGSHFLDQCGAGGFDAHAGQNGAGGVLDDSGDAAAALGGRQCRQQ